ncbi:MAG: response regulator transcription factor [Burkholderiales bacterium]|nr:response regulator transcription factor [Burkholderiales bacterium]
MLRALVVDDEALARTRMRTLLSDCKAPAVQVAGEAAHAVQAMEQLQHQPFDVVLLDIHMPGADGLSLARMLQTLPTVPALIFVTAHAEHALQAFELEATDYLTKPVRLERLQAALQKVERRLAAQGVALAGAAQEDVLIIQERGRTERVPLRQVVYFKAELKYVTVRTAARSYILDGSLNELEAKYPQQFLRIHRNALIARSAVRALEKHDEAEEGEGWAVRLHGVDEWLAVSRRQLSTVRSLIKA